MSEIMREPIRVVIDGKDCDAFDEDHTLADIARWIAKNKAEAEEMVMLLHSMGRGSMQ